MKTKILWVNTVVWLLAFTLHAAPPNFVNLGTANAGNGDPLRTAFGKVNQSLTNLDNSVSGPGVGQHSRGRDNFRLWQTVTSNAPVRFVVVGDSVAENVETTRGVRLAFEKYMPRGGFGSMYSENPAATPGGSLLFYMDNLVTQSHATYSAMPFFGFQNGQVSVSQWPQGAPLVDKVSIYFKANTTFGSWLLETNGGSGWGTRATWTAAFGSHDSSVTNFALNPRGAYNFRLTSTGTNVLETIGAINTLTTSNTVSWARVAKPGMLLSEVVQNPGFWVFYTNYAPQVCFFEVKDPAANLVDAANWIRLNLTNSDNVFITSSPGLPDTGGANDASVARAALVDFGRTNAQMVFDKYALFLPTNFWFSALPFDTTPGGGYTIWNDVSHLGAMGIRYSSQAFVNWFGCGPERFAMAGLVAAGAAGSDASKANLTGGNAFNGTQSHDGNIVVSNNAVEVRGGNGQFSLWDPVSGVDVVRLMRRADLEMLSVRHSGSGGASFLTVSNNGIGAAIWTSDAGTVNVLPGGKAVYHFPTNQAPSDTATVDWWLPVKLANGTTVYLPAYQ